MNRYALGAQQYDEQQRTTMTVKVAQIGIGYWGPNLARNLVANSRSDLRLVADLDADRRSFVKGLYPAVQVTDSVDDVFRDEEVQAVVIATPAATHFDFARTALEAGKHVLVEKPMATTRAEVEKLGGLASDRDLVAMVGHTFVYNSAVVFLRNLIKGGALGDLRYIYSTRVNLGRIRSDVDALWNFAPHDVSIIQYLLGEIVPIAVTRRGMDYVQSGIEDVTFLHLEYPDKVMAHIHVSWLDPHKVRRMTVVGTEKMVVYDDLTENKIAIYDKGIDPVAHLGERMDYDAGPIPAFEYRSGDVLLPKIPAIEPLAAEIDHWLDCILEGVSCRTGPGHAANVVRVLELASAHVRPTISDA